MAPQSIGNLHFLPVVLGCFAIIAALTAYGMAVQRGDVNALWPYISDAGSRPPESCIFGQFLNMAAVIAFVAMYIHYRHVKEFNVTDTPIILKLNYCSLWIAAFTCLGLSMVANFQETNSLPTHLTGAIMVFGLGALYCWIQAFISHLMRNQATSSALSSCTRFILSALVTLFFIITLAAGGAASAAHKEQYKNMSNIKSEFKWKETDDGYNAHLASTFCEWLMTICFLLFFLTYFREFQKINVIIQVQPKNAEIFSSGQSHHDEARIVV